MSRAGFYLSTNKVQVFYFLFLLAFLSSCAENYHLTGLLGGSTASTTVTTVLPPVVGSNCSNYGPIGGACSPDGQPVSVDVGGIAASPDPICTGGGWSIPSMNLCTLPPGPFVVTATITGGPSGTGNGVSNPGGGASPFVAIDGPLSDVSSNNCSAYGPLTGFCNEAGQTVTVDFGGIAPSPQPICSSSFVWSVPSMNLCALGNGPVTVTADMNDSSGNPAPQASENANVDQTPPAGPVSITPSPASPSNDPSTDLLVDCGLDAAGGTAVVTTTPANGFSPLYGVPQTLDANGQLNMTTITWVNGTFTIHLDCFDAVGNGPTNPSLPPVLTINTGAPSVGINGPLPDVNLANCSSYGPLTGSCSENGQTVVVDFGGIAPSPQPICTSNAWTVPSLNACGLPNGPVSVTADMTDSFGVAAPQATETANSDQTPPTVGINAPLPDVNSNNCSSYGPLTGTCSEHGQTVIVDFGGIAPSPQPLCNSGTWSVVSLNACSLPNGPVTVTADLTDASGNPAPQASAGANVDQTPPTGPVSITPSPASPSNDPSTDLFVDCGLDAAGGTAVVTTTPANGFSPLYGVPQTLDANGQLNMTTITWVNGTFTIHLDCFDAAGNGPTSPSPPPVLTINTGAPSVAINTPAPDVTAANCSSYGPLTGSCSENGQTVVVDFGGISPSPQPICTAGAWSVSGLNLCSLPQGSVSVTADHDDASGNSAPQATAAVMVDTILPLVDISNPSSGSYVNASNISSYIVSGTCSEIGQAVLINPVSPTTLVGAPVTVLCAFGGTWIAVLDFTGNSDGPLNISADHSDVVGNSAAQDTENFILDTTAPAGPVSITPSPASPSNDPSTDLFVDCGLDAAGGTAVVTTTPANGFSPLYGVPQTLDANGQLNMTTITWVNGTFTIHLDCFDNQGNGPTNPSPPPVLTINSTPPSVGINGPLPDVNLANCSSYGPLTGTCSENGQTVVVDFGGIAPSPQPICTSNTWTVPSLNACGLPDGPVNVTADMTDSFGVAAPQATETANSDQTPPTVGINAPLPDVNSNNCSSYGPLTGTCSEHGQTVVVDFGGIAPSPQPLCNSGTWSVASLNACSLPDGPVAVTADLTDASGNPAPQASAGANVDQTPPTVVISSSETSPTISNPVPVKLTFNELMTLSTINPGDLVFGNAYLSPGTLSCADVPSGTPTHSECSFDLVPITPGLVTVDFPAGLSDDLSGNGNLVAAQWNITYVMGIPADTSDQEVCLDVAVDASGNSYCAGYTAGSLAAANGGGYDLIVAKFDPNGDLVWIRQAGAPGGYTQSQIAALSGSNGGGFTDQYEACHGVAVDASGNVYCAGYTYSSLGETNGGHDDFFVIKFDSNGDVVWIKQAGSGALQAQIVTQNSANGGGHSVLGNRCNSVDVDSAGNVYCAGNTTGSLAETTPGTLNDFFVVKLDSNGDLVWIRQGGHTGGYTQSQIAALTSANGGGFLNGQEYCSGVKVDALGNVYCVGYTSESLAETNGGNTDLFFIKFDSNGDVVWARQPGASGGYTHSQLFALTSANGGGDTSYAETCTDIDVDSSGNVYCVGNSFAFFAENSTRSLIVVKLDSNGDMVWARQVAGGGVGYTGSQVVAFSSSNGGGGGNHDIAGGIAVDASGNVYIGGSTRENLAEAKGGPVTDLFVAMFDSSGDIVWIRQAGAVGRYTQSQVFAFASSNGGGSTGSSESCLDVAVDSSGNVFCGSGAPGDFGEDNGGANDLMMMKFDSNGDVLWVRQAGADGQYTNEQIPDY